MTAGQAVADLSFAARALAQTHPMTEASAGYRQQCFVTERERQPVDELADWASTAFLVGYCIRRVEEREASPQPALVPVDPLVLADRAAELSDVLRIGDAATVTLLDPTETIAVLDRVIGTELEKRHEHVREQLDDEDWRQLEEYISWWVVHGYCVRAAEAPKP